MDTYNVKSDFEKKNTSLEFLEILCHYITKDDFRICNKGPKNSAANNTS